MHNQERKEMENRVYVGRKEKDRHNKEWNEVSLVSVVSRSICTKNLST